ncbi:Iron/ascorbate family oxidoreductase [Handroanthus impetiginosus]|uniref:gibberellin 2beta-dioxygenase n=1 Tax=Handroanthus impetiginosus TaxID=429701 RepID=A0A2G9I0H3_9LAMI|nr:Iron/ascorbate family oxidoreductase [Handroanthus impetiginosus]
MVIIASQNPLKTEKIRDDIELPIIDLFSERSEASKLIVKACEQFGFFKVINHGVPQENVSRMEEETRTFFSRPGSEKQLAGPADPYGYGCQNIGLHGDMGEVEYLLLQTNPLFISQKSKCISNDPNKFSRAVSSYIEGVRELACEVLDLMAEGVWAQPTSVLSGLIRDPDSDSILRFNHYPPADVIHSSPPKIGFGAHTDPQILTLLRSNGSVGLQISPEDGVWVPVNHHPASAFCVNVGDVLQVMTNGRFLSVRHRVILNSFNSRTSMAFFAAPPLHATINCLQVLGTQQSPPLYRSFTWAKYKKATYTKRLEESRLDLFKVEENECSDNEY